MQTQSISEPQVTLKYEGRNDDDEYFYTASIVSEDAVYWYGVGSEIVPDCC